MDLERLRMADHASALLNAYVAATSRRHAPDQFLSIRFLEVERGTVRGRLDQYWDPERHSAATTEFVGHVGDDVIEGTFTCATNAPCAPCLDAGNVRGGGGMILALGNGSIRHIATATVYSHDCGRRSRSGGAIWE